MSGVRCTETGRGSKGSIFVCDTPVGDFEVRALREAPYKWSLSAMGFLRKGDRILRYFGTVRCRRNFLRRNVTEWLSSRLERDKLI